MDQSQKSSILSVNIPVCVSDIRGHFENCRCDDKSLVYDIRLVKSTYQRLCLYIISM